VKTQIVGSISKNASGRHVLWLVLGKDSQAKVVKLSIDSPENYSPELTDPQKWNAAAGEIVDTDGIWLFRNSAVWVKASNASPLSEVKLRVKHAVLREEKALARLARQVQAFENSECFPNAARERIPDPVRLFVWQRDEGKCVRCGASEKLEFDHIIPISKGGANTDRNIQLLCESCNRAKGADI
jgi:hypothetical protein